MSPVDQLREDGPLARSIPTDVVPIADVILVAVAVAVTAVPILGLFDVGVGATWLWVLAGVALALLGRSARQRPRHDWPVPALLRALEYGAVVILVGTSPVTYALLAVVAYRHYDIVYRERTRGDAPPTWLVPVTGGWELRTVLLAVSAASGYVEPVALVLAVWLGLVLGIESMTGWRRAAARDRGVPNG